MHETQNTPQQTAPFLGDLKRHGFVVYCIGAQYTSPLHLYNRKEFFKMCVITGENKVLYANRSYHFNGSVLFFGTHLVPYAWEKVHKEQHGFTALFTQEFFAQNTHTESLLQSPFFKIDATPLFSLTESQCTFIEGLFEKIMQEYATDYAYKDDLVRNYLQLILHEAHKLQPSSGLNSEKSSSKERIASLFINLLERQFPIESPNEPLRLTKAQQYAELLSVHTNSLNRAVKAATCKTTTEHILQRIISEAIALLQHTSWSVSEIAYSLGFEYPTYFHNSFKKLTGKAPTAFRT